MYNNPNDNIKKNVENNFLHIKNNFNIENISKTNNLDCINENNLCIICWSLDANTILCMSCKFKYCDDCTKKVNKQCCICHRNNKNKHIYFHDDEFEINSPHFYTTFLGIISSTIIFLTSCIGIAHLFRIFMEYTHYLIIKYLLN